MISGLYCRVDILLMPPTNKGSKKNGLTFDITKLIFLQYSVNYRSFEIEMNCWLFLCQISILAIFCLWNWIIVRFYENTMITVEENVWTAERLKGSSSFVIASSKIFFGFNETIKEVSMRIAVSWLHLLAKLTYRSLILL